MSLCLQLPLPSNFVVLLLLLTPVYPAITQLLNIHLPALLLAAYFQMTAKERKGQTSWFTDFTSCLDTHLGTHTPELPVVCFPEMFISCHTFMIKIPEFNKVSCSCENVCLLSLLLGPPFVLAFGPSDVIQYKS